MDDLASVIEQATGPAQAQNKPSDGGFDASVIADAINSHDQPKQLDNAPTPRTGLDKSFHDWASGSPMLELGLQGVTGTVSSLAGGLGFWGKLIQSGDSQAASKFAKDIQEGGTYEPQSAGAQKVGQIGGELIQRAGEGAYKVTGSPLAASIAQTSATAVPWIAGMKAKYEAANPKAINPNDNELPPQFTPKGETPTQFGSVGSAGATTSQNAAAMGASPEIQAAIQTAEKSGGVNYDAAKAHVEATSLPVPIQLTKGQATQDVNLLSLEKNSRAQIPELAQRYNEQNTQLTQNIDTIRDNAAPDVFHADHVEAGQALIDSYKEKDAVAKQYIAGQYKALSDANGGQLPLDGQTFVANANAALGKNMKGAYLPSQVQSIMNDILSGKQQMTFENFENLRTILASDARKFERSGDGNAAAAVSTVRNSLEDMPLTPEAQNLKPLADNARAAARARFQLLENDPAYKAAVHDITPADNFIQKYVIKAPKEDVAAMQNNLAGDEVAQQTVAHGAINYLKNRAGIVRDQGNFSQAGYNKALQDLAPKLSLLVNPETGNQLEALGNTARLTQAQPTGSYVNNSNTFTASLGKAAANTVEGIVNVKSGGIPVGSWVRNFAQNRKIKAQTAELLKPGAGIEK